MTKSGRAFLCTDGSQNRIAMVAATGELLWEQPCENPQDCWLTPDKNYLFCYDKKVVEILDNGRILWDYRALEGARITSLQPLPTGRFIALESGFSRLVELDNMANVRWEVKLTPAPETVPPGERFAGVRRGRDGHFWICRPGEQEVEELNSLGKFIRRFPVKGDVRRAFPLPTGNLLLALGRARCIQEMDASLKVVWEVGPDDISGHPLGVVTGFQRLPNGNTVICHRPEGKRGRVIEVTPAKEIVWELEDERFDWIHQIQLTDIPGNVMEGEVWR